MSDQRLPTIPYKPYVPQYIEHNLKPLPMPSRRVPAEQTTPTVPFLAFNKKREAQSAVSPSVNVPYAEVGANRPPASRVLNVGNNIENGWTTVENLSAPSTFSITERQEPVNPHQPMIDNNDFIDFTQEIAPVQPSRPPLKIEQSKPVSTPGLPAVGEYILVIRGELVASGTADAIEDQVLSFIDETTDTDDIVVMKRIGIKIGAFIAE
jgi:hypothetical protein